jgi:glycosyltransferase involved in cell wall biosynthesis
LDQADIFVMPSRTEGLPRTMIEAMARGLPCIGSAVGGIPELLRPEDMVPAGDASSLAGAIIKIAKNPKLRAKMSKINLKKSADYSDKVLHKQRTAFYEYLYEQTRKWQAMGRVD